MFFNVILSILACMVVVLYMIYCFIILKKYELFVASPCNGKYNLQQVAQRSSRKSRPFAHSAHTGQELLRTALTRVNTPASSILFRLGLK